MSTRLIVVANQGTREDRNRVTLALQSQAETFWWHRFEHAWLIVDPQERGAEWWRNWVITNSPSPHFHVLVIDADSGWWAAFMTEEAMAWLDTRWST